MKRVLSIQDLSCVGKCSLTVALPVLSAMGCGCSVLPTGILSTHTGFPDPQVVSLTGELRKFSDHWKSLGISFDCISVGYLESPEQGQIVGEILGDFPAYTVLDPVMGDDGRAYRRITPDHVAAMQALCGKSDLAVPNVTEAALLTGLPYRDSGDPGYLRELAAGVTALGAGAVLITGVRWTEDTIGFFGISREDGEFSHRDTRIPGHFHGTGDLFAAVLAGGILRGLSIPQAGALAAGFVRRCVENTPEASPFGVEFETQLPRLFP